MKDLLISVWNKIVHCFGVLLGWVKAGWCFVTHHLGCSHCTGKAVSKGKKKAAKRKPTKRKRSAKK